jgi:hypothetical protein
MNETGIRIAHAMPGRIRLKVDQIRTDSSTATRIEQHLASLPGVYKVETHPRTGSVLILYDASSASTLAFHQGFAESLAALFPGLEREAFESWQSFSNLDTTTLPPLAGGVRSFFSEFNAKLHQTTGGHADLKIVLPLSLFVLGVRSLVTTEKLITPTWYDFLWFALGTYFMLNPKPDEIQK